MTASRSTYFAALKAERAGDLLHQVLIVENEGRGDDFAETRAQARDLLADALRLLGIAVPDAPTNADHAPGANCVACRATDAGLDELSSKPVCPTCNGRGRIGDDIPCECAAGDNLRAVPVGKPVSEVRG